MIVYLASNNTHKCTEIQHLLDKAGVTVDLRSAKDIGGMPDVEENADSFVGNARLKAAALAAQLPDDTCWALADDSGLEVDALNGAPGVHSARYAGDHGNDAANNEKLLQALAEVGEDERTARFRCVLVLLNAVGEAHVFDGACEGRIARAPSGAHGFGYDPLFIPEGHDETFGTLGPDVKAILSHRASAVAAWVEWLEEARRP